MTSVLLPAIFLGGHGVPAPHRAFPSRRHAARPDRDAQGVRLRQRRRRHALPRARADPRHRGQRARHRGRSLARRPAERRLRPLLSVPLGRRSSPTGGSWGQRAAIGCGAGIIGALWGVARAVSLAPAEAMRAEAPARFRRGMLELIPAFRRLSPAVHIIARNLERRPIKTLLAIVGLGLAVGIVVTTRALFDAIDYMKETPVLRGLARGRDGDVRGAPGARRGGRARTAPGGARHRAVPRGARTAPRCAADLSNSDPGTPPRRTAAPYRGE